MLVAFAAAVAIAGCGIATVPGADVQKLADWPASATLGENGTV
jgi:hypothetical protein